MSGDDTPRDALDTPTAEELLADLSNQAQSPQELWRSRQRLLTVLGYQPGPIDGVPGRRTTLAIKAFQAAAGLTPDGVWGPNTQAAAEASLEVESPPEEARQVGPGYLDLLGGVELDESFWGAFVDLTPISNVQDAQKRERRKGKRPGSNLKRIVWHQTGFTWAPYKQLVLARKYSSHHKINAHVCFDTDGSILLIHPFTSYLWTANAFNPDCLSFEIMGSFEGVLGTNNWFKPEVFGRSRPARIQLIRARQFTKWLLDPSQGPGQLPMPMLEWQSICRSGVPLKWVNSHNNGTDDRPIDCGSECWYHIGEHTISMYPQITEGPLAGRGRPTPEAWRALPVFPPLNA